MSTTGTDKMTPQQLKALTNSSSQAIAIYITHPSTATISQLLIKAFPLSIARALSSLLRSHTELIEPDLNLELPEMLSAKAKRPEKVVLETHLSAKYVRVVLEWMTRYCESGGVEKKVVVGKGGGKARYEIVDLWMVRDAAVFLGVEVMIGVVDEVIDGFEEELLGVGEVVEVFEKFEEGHEARKSVLKGWATALANGKVEEGDWRLAQLKAVDGVDEVLKVLKKEVWDVVDEQEAPEEVVAEEEALQQGNLKALGKMALEGLKKFPL